MKLLLADDDLDQLELRSLTLARAGYEICTASTGRAALDVAIQQRPTIAVLDLRIPTEDAGLHLIRALKKLDNQIRLIVLTGTDPKRFDSMPERALVEAVITKGNASRKILELLIRRKLMLEGQLVLDVKVTTRSTRSEVVELSADGAMKVRVAAVPERGKANDELIALIAGYFGVRKDAVELVSGDASQRKRLRIHSPGTI